MEQKSLLGTLLCFSLLMGLLSGCGGGQPDALGTPDAPTVETTSLSGETPLNEYERAVWYGFVPEELVGADPDSTVVTWVQFCGMLGNVIRRYDSGVLAQWDKETAKAPGMEMKRDGGMVALLFAAKTMGMAQFNADSTDMFSEYSPRVWDVVSMDYPVFQWNTPIDLGDGCSDENHVGPAYDFCQRRVSNISGKPLLEFDGSGDLRLEQPFTLRESVLAAARLYESDEAVTLKLLNAVPRYVPLADAAEHTIGPKYLALAKDLPPFEDLPPTHAMILKPTSYQELFGSSLIRKEMIDMVADTEAFNAVHIGYECEFYYSDTDETIDLAYLENLDRVIEWCVSRGLHVIWDFASIPGYAGAGPNGDILSNPEHYRQAVALMELFSARYADVPSGVISFYILGESDSNYFSEGELVKLTNDLTAGLRQNSPDRGVRSNVWMSDQAGAFLSGWCEGLSKTDTTVGFELYPLNVPTLMGFPENSAANGRLYADGGKLTIKGNFQAGTTVTFLLTSADGVGLGLDTVVYADGREITRLDCDTLDESHERFIQRDGGYYVHLSGFPLSATLESDTKEIVLRCLCNDPTSMVILANIAVQSPSDQEQTCPEFYHRVGDPVTSWRYETGHCKTVNIPCSAGWVGTPLDPPTITIHNDGSYDIDQGVSYFQTPESIWAYVQKWADWGEQTDTPVWVSESGYPMSLPTEDRVAYIRCYAETLNEYGIGWTLFTNFENNWGPIIHKSALENSVSEPPNSGYTEYGDFYLDEPVLEVLREYLPD